MNQQLCGSCDDESIQIEQATSNFATATVISTVTPPFHEGIAKPAGLERTPELGVGDGIVYTFGENTVWQNLKMNAR